MRNAILRISSAVSTATDAVITGGTSRFPRTPSTGPLRGRALRASRALAVERDLGRPHRDRVAGAELCALHALAVHLHAVRRAEVDDPVRRALLSHLRVTARHVRVRQLDVAVARATEHDAPLLHLVPRTVE